MKTKVKTVFICTECGASYPKWAGRCLECGAWNSLIEEREKVKSEGYTRVPEHQPEPIDIKVVSPVDRLSSGVDEFDRVIGGGFVKGSVVLIGGEPGIGKSTLALQILQKLSGEKLLYFSGEESNEQIRMRASRLGIADGRILVDSESNLENILSHIESYKPVAVVVDSIQTTYSSEFDNLPGSLTQVRECSGRLQREAKELGVVIILIGHITKEGVIAGPKVLEHLVDTVLYIEGDRNNFYRILRSVKNRFGSTNEIGVFEMKETGLVSVSNPSQIFLSERREHVPGSSITVSMEGTRPFLIEVQALVTQASYGTSQRTANGIDYRRLAMLIAVLEKRVGLPLGMQDVFVNLVGGLRVEEPSIDLGVISSIVSSFKNIPLDYESVMIGEVGLLGEVRPVPFIESRVNEAKRLGYSNIFLPYSNKKGLKSDQKTKLIGVNSIEHLLRLIF